jgi:hypothetical protein
MGGFLPKLVEFFSCAASAQFQVFHSSSRTPGLRASSARLAGIS